jgi:hypothetical protein
VGKEQEREIGKENIFLCIMFSFLEERGRREMEIRTRERK